MKMTWGGALQGEGSRRLAGGSARRRRMTVVVAAGVAVVCAGLLSGAGLAPAAADRAGRPGVSWGKAEPVPGLAKLNKGGNAEVTSLSCWSVNNCAAGGFYTDNGYSHAFVVAERKGRWDRAVQVPGLAALNTGLGRLGAQVTSVSCAPDGYCAAGGYYTDGTGHLQAFVVTRPKDRWRAAVEVPGIAALNVFGFAEVDSVSCPSAGSCAAAGTYADAGSQDQWFAASQANGVWGTAVNMPAQGAEVTSLSCWSAGDCALGGTYAPPASRWQAMVVTERNGVWGAPEQVPGTAALNTGPVSPEVESVSCAPRGYCALGGHYYLAAAGPDSSIYTSPFVATGRSGRWRTAVAWPNAPVLNGSLGPDDGDIIAVSCPSAGNCAAAGYGQDNTPQGIQAMVVSQKNGVWGMPSALAGALAEATIRSLSCPSAGNCGAGGGSFVASESNGRWTRPEHVPGINTIYSHGWGSVRAISCPSAGHCTAAGLTSANGRHHQAFVTGP